MEEIDSLSPDRIICAGDLVGYYSSPNEVIELFRRRKVPSINGNHDRALLTGELSWFNWMAARAITWTRERIRPDNLEFLRGIPNRMVLGEVSIFHGSPYDDDEYVLPHEAHRGILEKAGTRIVVLGHTHIPFMRRYEEGIIVNPGSVGQPRDGDRRASFGILDLEKETFEVHRVEYDIERTAEMTVEAGLPEPLAERLWHGI